MSITEPQDQHTNRLSEGHRRTLEEGSRIARDVLEASGARTVRSGADLPPEYTARQRRRGGGILFDVHHPDGGRSTIYRPDSAGEATGPKYEQECSKRGGAGNVLAVHPRQRHLWDRADVPVWLLEGMKKQLAVLSALAAVGGLGDVLVLAISGTWNWRADGKPIPQLEALPGLRQGRECRVWYDSDLSAKWQVAQACDELCRYLSGRGAAVEVVIAPAMPDGSKRGADDHLAADGTLREAAAWCEPWTPATFSGASRMRRDDQLRGMVADMWRTAATIPRGRGTGRGACTAHDVYVALYRAAPERGAPKPERGGCAVSVGWRELMRAAAISSKRTLSRAIARLEGWGLVERLEADNPHKTGGFLVRAEVYHYGTGGQATAQPQEQAGALYARGTPLRGPRLRWSSPGYKPSRARIREDRKGGRRQPAVREPVSRLGKKRGAVIDALERSPGGRLSLRELCGILASSRARDVRRRVLPMLEDAGILTLEGEIVALAPDWADRLEAARRLGGEQAAAREQRERHRSESAAYRRRSSRDRRRPSKPSRAGLANVVRSRRARREHLAKPPPPRPQPDPSEATERVATLVRQGMLPRFIGLDGPTSRRGRPPGRDPVPAPGPDGITRHPGDCACWWCA